jgi:hypothetical protein
VEMDDCGIVVATVAPSEDQSEAPADHGMEAESSLEAAVDGSEVAVVDSWHD